MVELIRYIILIMYPQYMGNFLGLQWTTYSDQLRAPTNLATKFTTTSVSLQRLRFSGDFLSTQASPLIASRGDRGDASPSRGMSNGGSPGTNVRAISEPSSGTSRAAGDSG